MNKPEITREQAGAINSEIMRVRKDAFRTLSAHEVDLLILRDYVNCRLEGISEGTEAAKHFDDFWTLFECLRYGWTVKTPERKLMDEIDKLLAVSNEHRKNDPFHEGAAVKIHEVKNKVLRYFKETGRMPE